ncbi:hypothetical protein L4C33_08240, partial [Vibrio makurazakiensis]|uniref:glycerophosphodiester phosphodiesterase family protein n=1 Tax=Vibrio makurazakiensis TaxID=2910250 RepID=UPI003D0CA74A
MHKGIRLLAVLISCIFILVLSIFPTKISISIVSDLLSGKVNAYENENNNIANLIIQSNYLIAHAGGGIDGLKYTNSLEAVENSIRNGFKMIELDLLTSLDGEIVAAHDWNHFHSITDSNQTNKISHFDFMRKKIYGTYHPLDIATATDKLNKNDIILITDKIQDLNNLSKHRLNKNRTVVEVFSIEKYNEAISLG